MNERPFFSVITVCYNSSNTIERTIKSVLSQTDSDYEYIIIDGKSTDNTVDIISNYVALFNNKLTYISEPDKGLYDAMNKGVQMAKGQVISFLNADDYYYDQALSTVFTKYRELDFKTIVSGALHFKYRSTRQLLYTSHRRFVKKLNSYQMGVRFPATFIPKQILMAIEGFNLDYKNAADMDLIFRSYLNGFKFEFIQEPLTVMADGGISNSKEGFSQILCDYKLFLNTYCENRILKHILYLKMFLKRTISNFFPLISKINRWADGKLNE